MGMYLDIDWTYFLEDKYLYAQLPEQDWTDVALTFWDSLDHQAKERILCVESAALNQFCSYLKTRSFKALAADAITNFKLRGTWELHICPAKACLCSFADSDSLITHIQHCHFPGIGKGGAWRRPRYHPPEEKQLSEALHHLMWEPIDLDGAIDLLPDNHQLIDADDSIGSDFLSSVEWPLSSNPVRRTLTRELGDKVEQLIAAQQRASFPLRSVGCLKVLVSVAREHLLRCLISRKGALPMYRIVLQHSPLAFRFMSEDSLSFFLRLVEDMHCLLASAIRREEELAKNGTCVHCLDAIVPFLDAVDDGFTLDCAKTEHMCMDDDGGVPSRLLKTPKFPSIAQVLGSACKIFEAVQNVTSSMAENLTHKSTMTGFQMEHELKTVRLYCKLQFLEPEVRQICALDCRIYLLSIIRSLLRMKLYVAAHLFQLESNTGGNRMAEELLASSEEELLADLESSPSMSATADEELETEPEWRNQLLHNLDLSMKESRAWKTKDIGLFFGIGINGLVRQYLQSDLDSACQLWEAKMHKSWQYCQCYCCNKSFPDGESLMVHMESEHKLGLSEDEYWLMQLRLDQAAHEYDPYRDSYSWMFRCRKASIDNHSDNHHLRLDLAFELDVVGGSSVGFDETIILDHSNSNLLVDPKKLSVMPSPTELKVVALEMRQRFMGAVNGLEDMLSHIRFLFDSKRRLLMSLEADRFTREASGQKEHGYTSKLQDIDSEIMAYFCKINMLKQDLSNFSVWDLRANLLPCIRSFLKCKIDMEWCLFP